LLEHHLSRAGYDLISDRVETPEAMKDALRTKEWDVILCDYSMPRFSARAALTVLKELGLDIPFIIISGTIGEEVAVEAMRAGAHDYLIKDNLGPLAAAIERQMHKTENHRTQKRAEEALKASEAELREIFGAMTDVILVLDAEGRHLKMAPTKPSQIYKLAAERVGKTLHEVFRKEKADFFLDHVRRALDQGLMHRVEYSLPIDGKEVWFEDSVSPMTKDSVIWILRDITGA
jgi:PAS domain S-box-containing protein